MEALLHAEDEVVHQLGRRGVLAQSTLFHSKGGDAVKNFSALINTEEVRHFTGVQNVTDVLHHTLPLDLRVQEHEHNMALAEAGLLHDPLQVIVPLRHAVATSQLNSHHLKIRHVGGQARRRLAPRSANADKQTVAAAHLQHAADTINVLDEEQEHHEIHRRLSHRVEVFQLVNKHGSRRIEGLRLSVALVLVLGIVVITPEEETHVIIGDVTLAILADVRQKLVHLNPKVLLRHLADEVVEPHAVMVVHETVKDHTLNFVHPKSDHMVLRGHSIRRAHQQTLRDPAEVTEVERVVHLAGSRAQVADARLVHLAR
mmetsp:Transcript_157793/g.383162  ORF Transcript_157793/g.383162 Transcript_157793/m.383162 type:complete len:315 (+) Transcript_157793:117-1061(+)